MQKHFLQPTRVNEGQYMQILLLYITIRLYYRAAKVTATSKIIDIFIISFDDVMLLMT